MSTTRKVINSAEEIIEDSARGHILLYRTGDLIGQAVPLPRTKRKPDERRWVVRRFNSCFYPKEIFKNPIPTWGLGADPSTFKVCENRALAEYELLNLSEIIDNNPPVEEPEPDEVST